MLSYIFGGLGEFVAPRAISNKEVKYFLEKGMFDRVLELIKQPPHNINVNERYDSGLTPLHITTAGGALELTIELLSQGADVTVCSSTSKNTPLHFASMNNCKAIVEILLRSGADPSVPNADGLIPAELTTQPSIREALMSTNWMSQSNVYPSFEQHRSTIDTQQLSNQEQGRNELSSPKVESRPPLEKLLVAAESGAAVTGHPKVPVLHLNRSPRGKSDGSDEGSFRSQSREHDRSHNTRSQSVTEELPSINIVDGTINSSRSSHESLPSLGEYRVLSARRSSSRSTNSPEGNSSSLISPCGSQRSNPSSPRASEVSCGHSLPLPHTVSSTSRSSSITSPRATPREDVEIADVNSMNMASHFIPPLQEISNSPLHVATSNTKRLSASTFSNSSFVRQSPNSYSNEASSETLGGHVNSQQTSLNSNLPVIDTTALENQKKSFEQCLLPPPFSLINSSSPQRVWDNSSIGIPITATPSHQSSRRISQTLLNNKDLVDRILEAVSYTAESSATMKLEFKDRSEVFKLCSRPNFQDAMADRLSTLLDDKPELATCRAVDMGNQASDGWTPLHCAAKFGNIRALRILLQCKGVSGWECDLLGRLPLHIAAGKSNPEICKVLMDAMQGVPLEDTTKQFSTPPTATSSIVGPNAPVDASGTTPLGSATREGKGKPSSAIRELLYQPRDSSIFAVSPFVARSGRTPFKRVHSSLRLRSLAKAVVEERSTEDIEEEQDRQREQTDIDEVYDMNVCYAHSEAQGWRGEMEDQSILLCPMFRQNSSCEMKWCAFGVLDGHGGGFTSAFVKQALSNILIQKMTALCTEVDDIVVIEAVSSALEESYIQADLLLSREPRMTVKSKVKPPPRNLSVDGEKVVHELVTIDNSGSTACVCLVGPTHMITANIGDARAVLAQLHDAELLSVNLSNDHKPNSEAEKLRITNAGCSVDQIKNTDNSFEISTPLHPQILRVARAFGDFRFKWAARTETPEEEESVDSHSCIQGFRALPPTEQAVTCFPEVISHKRSARDMFLILACDGVWDVLSSQEAVDFVYQAFLEELRRGQVLDESIVAKVSDSLVQDCLDRGSTDNISVVLVTFPALTAMSSSSSTPNGVEESPPITISTDLGFRDDVDDVPRENEVMLDSDPSPNPVNVIKVMADMNQNLPPSSPMKGTRLF